MDQHPIVVLFHKDARGFCPARFRLSVLAHASGRYSCKSGRQHPRCIPELWDCPFPRQPACRSLFAPASPSRDTHRLPVDAGGIIGVELRVVIRRVLRLCSHIRRIFDIRRPLRFHHCNYRIGDRLVRILRDALFAKAEQQADAINTNIIFFISIFLRENPVCLS